MHFPQLPTQFCRTGAVTPELSIPGGLWLSSSRQGILGRGRRGRRLLCNATPHCLEIWISTQVLIVWNVSSYVQAVTYVMTSSHGNEKQRLPGASVGTAPNTLAVHMGNSHNIFNAKSWWCWCCSCWGQLSTKDGCGRPDNGHLIHFSIQFAELWCVKMDRNKLMISKWNFSFI